MSTLASTPAETFFRVADEIGPRTVGAVYFNSTGTYQVLAVHRGKKARDLTGRRTDWAITVHHAATDKTFTHCMAWTSEDHLVDLGRAA